MLSWILSNLATLLISLLLIAVVVLILRYLRKQKKSDHCAGCTMDCGNCHQKSDK